MELIKILATKIMKVVIAETDFIIMTNIDYRQ